MPLSSKNTGADGATAYSSTVLYRILAMTTLLATSVLLLMRQRAGTWPWAALGVMAALADVSLAGRKP